MPEYVALLTKEQLEDVLKLSEEFGGYVEVILGGKELDKKLRECIQSLYEIDEWNVRVYGYSRVRVSPSSVLLDEYTIHFDDMNVKLRIVRPKSPSNIFNVYILWGKVGKKEKEYLSALEEKLSSSTSQSQINPRLEAESQTCEQCHE